MSYDWKAFQFGSGSHGSREDGMCVMECVAYIAGEEHTDQPACACPLITQLAIWVNDTCRSDQERNERLSPHMFRLAVSRLHDPKLSKTREKIAACWALDDFNHRAKRAGYWAKRAGYWAKETGDWAKRAGYWAKETGDCAKEAGYWAKEAGDWAKEAGDWDYDTHMDGLLDSACRLLDVLLTVGEIKEQSIEAENRSKQLSI